MNKKPTIPGLHTLRDDRHFSLDNTLRDESAILANSLVYVIEEVIGAEGTVKQSYPTWRVVAPDGRIGFVQWLGNIRAHYVKKKALNEPFWWTFVD